jgi:hypothetical protein
MKEEHNKMGLDCIAKSTFYKLWDDQFPLVTIPKENRFAKCSTCTQFKSALDSTMNQVERKKLSEQLEKHIDRVM